MAAQKSLFFAILFCACLIWVIDSQAYYPHTDLKNSENWTVYPSMTDEFNGDSLNLTKWYNTNPTWKGRQPGLFEPQNVRVNNGTLELWAYYNKSSNPNDDGYGNYTTSAVQSKSFLLYGYSEIRAKLGTSKISSSFWFNSNINGNWTEIDVFEESGPINQSSYFCDTYNENTHVFTLSNINDGSVIATVCNCTQNSENSDCSSPGRYTPNFSDFSSDFHIFAMNWTSDRLITYLDGQQVRNIKNYCLHNQLNLQFDRETMPDWFGLPDPSVLPDQPYTIDYVRTWVKQT